MFSESLENLGEKVEELKALRSELDRLVVVVGAGGLKRFIECGCDDAPNTEKDLIGIEATRLNASVMKSYFKSAYSGIPESFDDLRKALDIADTVVMGGTEPGHSTDAVAALAAEELQADLFVKATDVDGVYDRKPEEKGAKKLESISFRELKELISRTEGAPGSYSLMDLNACSILERSNTKSVVVDGTLKGEIQKAATGEHSGTIIS